MNISDAYNQLNDWINISNGGYIYDDDSDELYSFSHIRTYTDNELLEFELNNNFKLPVEYKSFLTHVGCVNIFSGEKTSGIEILSPFDISDFSRSVFYNFGDDLYPKLLLTTSIPKFGYLGGFWMGEKSPVNYGIFYPEIPSEYWVEECNFVNFNGWVINLIEFKAKKI
ncbi:SMI1/KNR4 family protein [Trabulsiella odontotermitis]|uniref:SMI1/KNR4 family protein n=1 Tax=Trabulsiella odontotermitis TaxID=379893 RepID=UPI003AC2ED35